MGTVVIGVTTYNIYGDQAGAILYHDSRLGGSVFTLATSDDQKRALVTATRWIDRMHWQGEKTSAIQALQFPRTNLYDCAGVLVDSVAVPANVVDATYELAMMLITTPTLAESPDVGSNTKRLKAGSAEIEYFRGTAGSSTRFPTVVDELLHCYLAGRVGTGPYVGGTDQRSHFDDCDIKDTSEGYM